MSNGGPTFGSGGFFGGGGGGGLFNPSGQFGAWPGCGCGSLFIILGGLLLVFGGCMNLFRM
jgi:hypothetical protein